MLSFFRLKESIGIGRSLTAPPSHTTQHTDPYCAVRLTRQNQTQGNKDPSQIFWQKYKNRDGHAFMRFFRCREAGAVRLTLDWCKPGLLATDEVLIPSPFTAQ